MGFAVVAWESIAGPWMTGRAGRWLAVIVNVALVLALARAMAVLTWRLVPQREPLSATVSVPHIMAGSGPAAGAVPSPAEEIAKWHLFGTPVAPTAVQAPQAVPEEVPETNLKLRLVGVAASSDAGSALAIIVDPAGQEQPYQVGDQLPGGAVLYAVQSDRVLLRRKGRLETLKLPVETSGGVSASGGVRGSDADGALRGVRDTLRSNPRELIGKVSIQPVRQDGEMMGYRLGTGVELGLLEQLGLQSGDVVTNVNGVALDSPSQGAAAMRQLTSSERVTVELLRGGQPHTLSFNPGR